MRSATRPKKARDGSQRVNSATGAALLHTNARQELALSRTAGTHLRRIHAAPVHASQSTASDVASDRSSLLFLLLLFLPPCQYQQLDVGRQHFPDGILKFPPRCDTVLDLLGPLRGDAIGVMLSVDHVGQGPGGMPLAAGTAAVGLSAAGVAQGQGSGELIRQWGQMTNNFKLTLAQARSV